MNKKLSQKILRMAWVDQCIRKSQFGHAKKIRDIKKIKAMAKALKRADNAHTKEMKKIIKRYGWPGKNLVGKKAAFNAWLLVQHADHDIVFQEKCLKLLGDAVERGEAEKKNLAYLTDRVWVHKNKKQMYGTQFQGTKSGRYKPFPISDPKNLDRRRKEMGMEPFAKYAKLFK